MAKSTRTKKAKTTKAKGSAPVEPAQSSNAASNEQTKKRVAASAKPAGRKQKKKHEVEIPDDLRGRAHIVSKPELTIDAFLKSASTSEIRKDLHRHDLLCVIELGEAN